jgi:hypothetical protein
MKKVVQYLCILLLIKLNTKAQSCNCLINLDSLIVNVERNYSGFDDKIAGIQLENYVELKKLLKLQASSVNNYECFKLLRKYVSFFKDPHLSLLLGSVPPESKYVDTLRKMFTSFQQRELILDTIMKYYSTRSLDSIEGMWNALDYKFNMAIIKENNRFIGIAVKADSIKWFPGQIKMEIDKFGNEYQIIYYKGDHLPDTITARINGNQMDLGLYGIWERTYPVSKNNSYEKEPIISFKKVSPSLSVLTVRSSWITYKSQIDSILDVNLPVIRQTPYLIIDLRNNQGGHAMTLEPILPILYTKPILRDGLYVRASYDNIALYKEGVSDPNLSEKDHESFKRITKLMEQNIGKLIKVAEGDTITYKSIYPYPKRVGIIVNKKTTSAAELFLLWAKQSKKVTIFGSRTRGALDYSEVGRPRALPCPYLQFYCPMGKSEHNIYPYIDNVGILPDVNVSEGELDNNYFINYFKNNNNIK